MKNLFLSHTEAAFRNRNMLLHFVKKNGPVSRTNIWENFNISLGSVTEIIKQLYESGLIKENGKGKSTGGRKPIFIVFDGSKSFFFAFQWTTRTLYLMDLNGKVFYEKQIDMSESLSPEGFVKNIGEHINNIIEKNICDKEEIIGFVLSLPGIIDAKNCCVVYSVELGWKTVPLRELFNSLFKSPYLKNIYIERTSNILAISEYSRHAKHCETHLQLFILDKSGIGVSTIIHNKLQHGSECMHGELGHIKLPLNVECACGQKGCLEAIVAKMIKENHGSISNEILDYLAIGVSTAVNICDTDVLLIGSYVNALTEKDKEYLSHAIHSKVTGTDLRKVNIRFAYDQTQMAQRGLCAYMFECNFPIN